MSQFIAEFITVAVVHLLAVMSPGPDFAIVTRNSLIYSRTAGLFTALGIGVGILVHVAYSLIGISFIISQSIMLFSLIKFIGAGYLLYIGYKSLKAKKTSQTQDLITASVKEISNLQAYKQGFLTNALNPKATLFFLAVFTQVIHPYTPKLVQLVYGLEMMVMTAIWFSLVAFLFSHGSLKKRIMNVAHIIERVTGAVLIALGIKVALSSHK